MGVSTDGILCYGVDCGDTPPWAEVDEDGFAIESDEDLDFEDWFFATLGKEPFDYKERRKILDPCPVDVVWHCSYDYPMYVVALRGTEKRNSRGYPEKLGHSIDVPLHGQTQAAAEFCEEHGLCDFSEAQWLLVSMWG